MCDFPKALQFAKSAVAVQIRLSGDKLIKMIENAFPSCTNLSSSIIFAFVKKWWMVGPCFWATSQTFIEIGIMFELLKLCHDPNSKKANKQHRLLQGHLFCWYYCWNLSYPKSEVWGKGRSSNKWHFFGSWCQKWQETQIPRRKLNWFPPWAPRNFWLVILFLTTEEWRWGSFFYLSNSLIFRISP